MLAQEPPLAYFVEARRKVDMSGVSEGSEVVVSASRNLRMAKYRHSTRSPQGKVKAQIEYLESACQRGEITPHGMRELERLYTGGGLIAAIPRSER